ncbi:MAG: phosphatidate cytidylyltransferase [Clostridiales bacterium]|nr:phosphatidate cytidylyltransferase [Clostridiales bacterium]
MVKRIISGVIGGALLLFFGYCGEVLFAIAVAVTAAVAAYEYAGLIGRQSEGVPIYLLLASTAVLTLSGNVAGGFLALFAPLLVFLGMMAWAMANSVAWNQFCLYLAGCYYIGLGFASMVLLRFQGGFSLLLLLLIIVWGTDIGAYFIGSAFGKRPLAQNISPNKTLEGSIGGLALALLGTLIYSGFAVDLPWHWWQLLLIALAVSLVGQMGDLLESSLKRWAGVKNSGNILPGHGGILDRFDSMLLAAPLLYLVFHFLSIN